MAIDISTEYLNWDNTEAVTVTVHKDGRDLPSVSVANALRVNPTNRFQTVAGIMLSSQEEGWWIPIAQLGADIDMDVDGEIRDANGDKYRLRTARRINLGNSYSHWEVATTKELVRT